MPTWPTSGPAPVAAPPALRGTLLVVLAGVAVLTSAGPAAAAQDPSRPQAAVTRGPSCEPGGVEIAVVAGTVPYRVVLATTRRPEGEDEADLSAGATAVLHAGDVDWGETIDSRLVYTALDGSGAAFTDELDDWTMTRPSQEDCAALALPAAGTGGTTAPTSAAAGAPSDPPATQAPERGTIPGGTAPASTGGAGAPPSAPRTPGDPGPASAVPSLVVSSGAAGGDGPSGRAVAAGRPITVSGAGFQPGEDVVLRLHGTGAILARGTAAADGTVALALTVPPHVSGPTDVDLTGSTSQTSAPLRLQVAALGSTVDEAARTFTLAALLALLALTASAAGLVSVTRRAVAVRRPSPTRGA